MIEIYTPSGIGDIYWLLQKLQSTGERFSIRTPPGDSAVFNRAKFLLNLEGVDRVAPTGMHYSALVAEAKKHRYEQPFPRQMFLEANTHLEAGRHISEYMPNLKTEYKLNWKISEGAKVKADKILSKTKKNIIVYTSGVKNNDSQATGIWSHRNWIRIFKELNKLNDINLIWIGADYDSDMLNWVKAEHALVDAPADIILQLLRSCDGFVSYQCGLSCISVSEGIPTTMLFFKKIENLIYTICSPSNDKNTKAYNPIFFNELPEKEILDWVASCTKRKNKDENEIKNKTSNEVK